MFKLLAAVVVLVSASQMARAQADWNGVRFTPPAGWAERSEPDAYGLTLKRGGQTEAMILVFSPVEGASAKSLIQTYANGVNAEPFEPDDIRSATSRQGWPATYATGFAELEDARLFHITTVLTAGKKQIGAMLVDFDFDEDHGEQAALGALLASVALPGTPPAVAGRRGGLQGFYVWLGPVVKAGLLGSSGVEFGADEMQLFQDGRVVLADPHRSGEPGKFCQSKPTDCGTYSAAGSTFSRMRPRTTYEERLQLTGEDTRASLKRLANGDLEIDGQSWRRIGSQTGKTLNGDFVLAQAAAAAGVDGQSSSLYSETLYRFRPDGRVWEGGYAAFVSNSGESLPDSQVATSVSGGKRLKSGRYSVADYTLTINWDDGTRETQSFYMIDDVPVIDDDLYTAR